jgi:hypothetical protein
VLILIVLLILFLVVIFLIFLFFGDLSWPFCRRSCLPFNRRLTGHYLTGGVSTLRQMYQLAIVR